MDYRCGLGRDGGKRMYVRHNVVAKFLFKARRLLEIDIVKMPCHLLYLALRYIQAELHLRLCQLQPEPSPRAELLLRAEKLSHFP